MSSDTTLGWRRWQHVNLNDVLQPGPPQMSALIPTMGGPDAGEQAGLG